MLPQTAQAASIVSMSESYFEGYKGSGGYSASLLVSGGDGPDAITVTDEGGAVLVHDPGGVVASSGCAVVLPAFPTDVRCAKRGSLSGRVRAGGGDDVVKAPFELEGGGGNDVLEGEGFLSGGAGDDVLRGGGQADLLDGGPGTDKLNGGGQRDLALYVDRDESLDADLGRGSVGVGLGENDHLASVEGIVGGRGDDRLTGSAGEDFLYGGRGDDALSGGAGADDLIDHTGRDVLDGGPGDDRLSTSFPDATLGPTLQIQGIRLVAGPTGAASMLGGPGADALSSGPGSDRIDGGAGRDGISAGGGSDRVWLRDGQPDEVRCGRRAVSASTGATSPRAVAGSSARGSPGP